MDVIAILWTLAAGLATAMMPLLFTRSPKWVVVFAILVILEFLLMLVLIALYIWRAWQLHRVSVRQKTYTEKYASVLSVRLDPVYGVVADVLHGAEIVPTIINPEYFHLLPGCAISNKQGLEAAVAHSVLSKVSPRGEPTSLVAISDGYTVVGYGSRVKYNGATYLLTASHVWNGKSTQLFLVKGDSEVGVDTEKLKPAFGCNDIRVDFCLVPVPDPIWTKLGVKASPLSTMEKRSLVTVYGGANPLSLVSSSGLAVKGEYIHDIEHHCSTGPGWSGSPLYSKGCVVGIHVGSKLVGKSNRAVNAGVILGLGLETVYSEISAQYLEPSEVLDRSYDFIEVELINGRRLGIGKGEWYDPTHRDEDLRESRLRSRGFVWSEVAMDETGHDEFFDAAETVDSHLNSRGAAAAKRLPPSEILEIINGPSRSVSPVKENAPVVKEPACLLPSVEERMLNLEKQVSTLISQVSLLLSKSSPSSEISAGPKEAPAQSSALSDSKPQGSGRRRRRKASAKQSETSAANIQPPTNTPVSKDGMNARSRRKSRRSVNAVSIARPPQESPMSC
nr:polyprotein P2a [Sobemovirus sp.]